MQKTIIVLATVMMLGFSSGTYIYGQKPASGVKTERIPEIPKKLIKQYALYQDYYSAYLIGWTAKGKLLIRADVGNGMQVCKLDTTSSFPTPITKLSETPRSIKPGPKLNHGFTYRKGSKWQYFFYDSHRKRSKPLTRSSERAWGSCSGLEKFAFSSNRRNGRDYDIYTTTVTHPDTATRVYEANGQWMPLSFSPDDSKLLIAHFPTFSFNHLYILDIASGETIQVTDPKKQTWFGYNATFSADGKRIYYAGKDFWVYDLATKSTSNLSAGGVGTVSAFAEAKDASKLIYTTKDKKGGVLHILDGTGKEIKHVKLPKGATATRLVYDPRLMKIAATFQSAIAPDRVATYNVTKDRWSEITYKPTEISDKFVDARMIRYPTFDSDGGKPREIEAVYFERAGNDPHPVLIELHGGLNHQANPYFDPFKQYLINEFDMAVLMPNFRGSSGYGKEFQDLDNGYGKRDAIKDIAMLLDWIEAQEELDANKVIIYGISQGGRLSMSVLSQYSDRLIGGIAGAGIYDIQKSLSTVLPNEMPFLKTEFGDWSLPEFKTFLRDLSPIQHAGQITQPVFLFHGGKDKVVSPKQTIKYKEALKQNGNLAWWMSATTEGHFEWKKENQLYLEQALIVFIEQTLKTKKK